MSTLGERIKQIRKSAKLTQDQFAESISVSSPSVSRYEKDDYEPSAPVLNAIADKYGVNREWLLTGNGEQKPTRTKSEELTEILMGALVGDSARDQMIRAFARLPEEAYPKMLEYIQQFAKLAEEEK